MDAKKILIVDDDVDLVRSLALNLKVNGFQVRTAGDAQSGLSAVRREKPDLIVLDIGLPGTDGFTVMEVLSKLSVSAPVVVFSAGDSDEYRPKALEKGAKAYFRKPTDSQEFLATIQQLLEPVT